MLKVTQNRGQFQEEKRARHIELDLAPWLTYMVFISINLKEAFWTPVLFRQLFVYPEINIILV